MTTACRSDVAAWWTCGVDRWLQVRVASVRGGVTDGGTAAEYVGAASWVHGDYVYLAEADGLAWLASIGQDEGDVTTTRRDRRPDGFLSSRDAETAAVLDGSTAWFESRDSSRWGDAQTWSDGTPVPTCPADEDLTAVAAPVVKRPRKAARPTPAAAKVTGRKAANRALAAELRALGYVPNGQIWAVAKSLRAAGQPVTRTTLEVAA